MEMDVGAVLRDQEKEILGAWLLALGYIISAIASTPTNRLAASTQANLNTIGLTLKAAGSGLETEGQSTPFSLESIAHTIVSIGILESLTASVIEFPHKTDTTLTIQGTLLQAVGLTIAALDETQDSTTAGSTELFIGNVINAIGAAIQIMGIKIQSASSQQEHDREHPYPTQSQNKKQNHVKFYRKWNEQNTFNVHEEHEAEQEGAHLIAIGSWIRAIGAVLAAIGQQKEETQELLLGIDE